MQKQLLVFLSLFCFHFIASAQSNVDVLHYKYAIELSDKSDTIKGKAGITVKFTENSNRFFLNLTSVSRKQGMIAYRVLCDNEIISSTHGNDSLFIILPATAKKDEIKTYEVLYQGIPGDGLIISKNKFGKRTFFSDNWPNRAHHWIPCKDDPSDKASFEFIITAPDHYQVVSNGIQTEEKHLDGNKKLTHWKEDIPLPTKIMVIGAADFAVDNIDTVNNIPVSSWVFTQNKNDGFKDYSIAPSILSFFIDYIGPFPYKKLANVQSKTIFGGMENAGAIFYFENSVDGMQDQERLFAHEIAHQWFGDMVTEKKFAHLWLSEGFATYLSHIFIESKYGTDSLNNEMRQDRVEAIGFVKGYAHPVVDSITDYMSLLNNNSYQKGGWILHMLRRQLGDSVFHYAIKEYYQLYAGKNADTHDLQLVFEKTSGQDLGYFFQQWLYTPANPSLEIKWKYSEADKKILITVNQLQQNVFTLPLQVGLVSAPGKLQIETLHISHRTETFSLAVSENIKQLIADPAVSLLAETFVENIR